MIALLSIYLTVGLVWAIITLIWYCENDGWRSWEKQDRRSAARAFLATPIWPLVAGWLLFAGLIRLIKTAVMPL